MILRKCSIQSPHLTFYVCSICKCNFQDNKSVISHMITVHNDNIVIQNINHCKESLKFDNSSSNKGDEKKVRRYKKQFECDQCDYTTIHMTTYKRHLMKHNKDYPKHRCKFCSFSTIQPYNLQLHLKNVHPHGGAPTIEIQCEPGKLLEELLKKYQD